MLYLLLPPSVLFLFFFFNDTATTEIYTLSLHDALPICDGHAVLTALGAPAAAQRADADDEQPPVLGRDADRKSTRLNSSHVRISYAVFCLKKKKYGRMKGADPLRCARATTTTISCNSPG